MKETKLLKLAMICSLVGLVMLFFISTKIEIKDYKPGELSKNIGDSVKLEGKVTGISQREGVVLVNVEQKFPVTVIIFTDVNISELKENDAVEVLGKVQDYNGKEEIIAQKVRVIKKE